MDSTITWLTDRGPGVRGAVQLGDLGDRVSAQVVGQLGACAGQVESVSW